MKKRIFIYKQNSFTSLQKKVFVFIRNNLFLLTIMLVVIISFAIGITDTHPHKQKKKEVPVTQEQKQKQKNVATPLPSVAPGIPLQITIPKIHIQAAVESVGMDAEGRMDVPKIATDSAWYSPGYKPGMKGSAVIDGHLDDITGAPAVFWNLKKLTKGDVIIIKENNNRSYIFSVYQLAKYPYNNFPIQKVFAEANTPLLNLITCNGVWDNNTKNYSDRLVIYAKLLSIQ